MRQISMSVEEFLEKNFKGKMSVKLEEVTCHLDDQFLLIPKNIHEDSYLSLYVQFENGIYCFTVNDDENQKWVWFKYEEEGKIVAEKVTEQTVQHFEKMKKRMLEINQAIQKVGRLYQAINKK